MAQSETDKLYALLEALIGVLQEEDPDKRRDRLAELKGIAELKGRVQSEMKKKKAATSWAK